MPSVKSSVELAINTTGNAISGVANLNANFQRTFNSLDNINNSVKIINGNLATLPQPTKIFAQNAINATVGINALLGVVQKVAPAIMNAANAANVLEANINKAALSNLNFVKTSPLGYGNLEQNVTRFGNEAISAAMKAGDGIENVLNSVSALSKSGLSQTVSFSVYSDISNFAKGFQTSTEQITNLYGGLNQLKGVDVSNLDTMKNAMNGINFAMNASKITIDEYANMLKNNAPQFNAFGFGVNDINKMILHLADSGFSGNNIIQNIEQINKAMIKAQKTGKSVELNGEALLAYNHLLNSTQSNIEQINKNLRLAQANDYIGKIAAQISKTNSDRIGVLFNRIKAVGAVFLAVFVPIVAFALDIIEPFFNLAVNLFKPVKWLLGLISENFEMLIPALATIVALVAPFALPFILVVAAVRLIAGFVEEINKMIDEGNALGYILAGIFGTAAVAAGVILARQVLSNGAAFISNALAGIKNMLETNYLGLLIKQNAMLLARIGLIALAGSLVAMGVYGLIEAIKAGDVFTGVLSGIALILGVIMIIMLAMGVINPFAWIGVVIAGVVALVALFNRLRGKATPPNATLDAPDLPENPLDKYLKGFGLKMPNMPNMPDLSENSNSRANSTVASGGSSKITIHEIRIFLDRNLSAVANSGERSSGGLLTLNVKD